VISVCAVATAGVNNDNSTLLPCHRFRLRGLIVIDSIVAESRIHLRRAGSDDGSCFACMTEARISRIHDAIEMTTLLQHSVNRMFTTGMICAVGICDVT
jgi:hypothetical protein